MPDALRLALGTLTVIGVPAPRSVTARVAGRAMLLAPLVGVLLALLASAVPVLVGLLAAPRRTTVLVDLLTAGLAVAALALLTRGLHLDGLADTVDGLGVKGVDGVDSTVVERRLAVMRAPDVGAFGAVALVLVVLLQVTALAVSTSAGVGTAALVVAVATGRLAATWCCAVGVPSARSDGLGAAVAGTVPRRAALAMTIVVLVGAALLGSLPHPPLTTGLGGQVDGRTSVALVVAVLVGLGAGALLLRRCVVRFGGITGDVLGAVVEVTTTAALVTIALASTYLT
jgi:adenosylcobinamide-GDP ribazoletransferase